MAALVRPANRSPFLGRAARTRTFSLVGLLPLMHLEEIPHQGVGRDVQGGSAEDLCGRSPSRPGMALDHDQHQFRPVPSPAVGLSGHSHPIIAFGQHVSFRGIVAAVRCHPRPNRPIDGTVTGAKEASLAPAAALTSSLASRTRLAGQPLPLLDYCRSPGALSCSRASGCRLLPSPRSADGLGQANIAG
jgi:hypothetical protein